MLSQLSVRRNCPGYCNVALLCICVMIQSLITPRVGSLSVLVEKVNTFCLFINEHVYYDGKAIHNSMGLSMMLLSVVSECLIDANFIFKLAWGVKSWQSSCLTDWEFRLEVKARSAHQLLAAHPTSMQHHLFIKVR